MQVSTKNWLRGGLIAAAIIVGGVVGSVVRPAMAQQACENDACSRVCHMGSCWGECYDAPGSGKQCDMIGSDCQATTCEPT